jgi:hypothetical protein
MQNPDGSWTDAVGEQSAATLTVSAACVLLAAEQGGPVRYPAMQDLDDESD